MSMIKIKSRHVGRARRRSKHTTRKGYRKYRKHYTRKNVKRTQCQGKGRLRKQRQTRRKVGGADNLGQFNFVLPEDMSRGIEIKGQGWAYVTKLGSLFSRSQRPEQIIIYQKKNKQEEASGNYFIARCVSSECNNVENMEKEVLELQESDEVFKPVTKGNIPYSQYDITTMSGKKYRIQPATQDPNDPPDPKNPPDPNDPPDPKNPPDPNDPPDPKNPPDPNDPPDPKNLMSFFSEPAKAKGYAMVKAAADAKAAEAPEAQPAADAQEYGLTTDMIKDMLKKEISFSVSPRCMFLCEDDHSVDKKYCVDTNLLEKIRTRFIEFIKRKKNKGNFTYDIDFDFNFDDDDDYDDTDYKKLPTEYLHNNSELLAKMLEKNSMFFIVDNLVEKVTKNKNNIALLNDDCYKNIIRKLYVTNKLFPILLTLISKIRNENYNEVTDSVSFKNLKLLLELLKKKNMKDNMTLLYNLLNNMSPDNMGKLLRLLESMTPESISKLLTRLDNLNKDQIEGMLNSYINLNKNHNSMAQLLELYSFIERTPGYFSVHRYKDGKPPLLESGIFRNKNHKLETCRSVAALDKQVENVFNEGALRLIEDDEFKKVLAECKLTHPELVSSGGRKRRTLKKKRGGNSKR